MNIRTLVISGGSSGIGKSIINKFISTYKIFNLDINNCNDYVTNPNYRFIKTDVTNHENIKSSIKEIITEAENIDVLITSAGIHLSANIEDTSDAQLNEVISLNLLGSFWLIQETIAIMKRNKKGAIITIGSDQSSVAKKNSTIYGMTKAALLSLTKSIALDYGQYNIKANCIGAGTIDTPLYRNAIKNYSNKSGLSLEQINNDEAAVFPLGRIGKSEEVAELAYFLASDKAEFITGALLPIDGGYIAQ